MSVKFYRFIRLGGSNVFLEKKKKTKIFIQTHYYGYYKYIFISSPDIRDS